MWRFGAIFDLEQEKELINMIILYKYDNSLTQSCIYSKYYLFSNNNSYNE